MKVTAKIFVDRRRVLLTPHSVARFRQRGCSPGTSFGQALTKLKTEVRQYGRLTRQRPKWVRSGELRNEILTEQFLVLDCEDYRKVVFPLVAWPNGLVATTCLVRRAV